MKAKLASKPATTERVVCMVCGGSVAIGKVSGNIGEISRRSGYEPIIRQDTSMRWICPVCLVKAVPHIQALRDLFKDELLFWDGLPALLKRDNRAVAAALGKAG